MGPDRPRAFRQAHVLVRKPAAAHGDHAPVLLALEHPHAGGAHRERDEPVAAVGVPDEDVVEAASGERPPCREQLARTLAARAAEQPALVEREDLVHVGKERHDLGAARTAQPRHVRRRVAPLERGGERGGHDDVAERGELHDQHATPAHARILMPHRSRRAPPRSQRAAPRGARAAP
jgi:hypothetical protein